MKKHKVLFVMQLPPPIHGASLMNKYIEESKKVNESFISSYLPLNFANKIQEIGKFSFFKIYKMGVFIFKLCHRLLFFKPDLIYYTIAPFGFAFYRDALFVFFIKLFRIKIVFHLHGLGIKENIQKSLFRKYIYSFVFKDSSIIVLSDRLIDDIKLVQNRDTYILNNAIAYQKHVLIRDKVDRKITFIFLSNLIINKGIKIFLEAVNIVRKRGYDFNIKIIGKSTANFKIEDVKQYIKTNKLNDIISDLGPKYGKEKYQALNEADVLVFPSVNEAFGLVNLEAMQMGLAIISTNSGAIPDIIEHNRNGLIVDDVTPKEISKMMIKYIENKQLILDHGANNKLKFKERYTLEIFEQNLIDILNQILYTNES